VERWRHWLTADNGMFRPHCGHLQVTDAFPKAVVTDASVYRVPTCLEFTVGYERELPFDITVGGGELKQKEGSTQRKAAPPVTARLLGV
jgi:hypothetical protein